MATRGRRYLSVTLETLLDDPQLLRHAPAPTATGVYHLETLNLETILMNSHKVSFAEPHRLWQAVLTGGVLQNRHAHDDSAWQIALPAERQHLVGLRLNVGNALDGTHSTA